MYEVEHAKNLKKKTTEMYEEIRMAKLLKTKAARNYAKCQNRSI